MEKAENGYLVRTEGWRVPADSVIICCGSCSPRSPVPMECTSTLPISFSQPIPVFPALCSLRRKGNQFSSWAGVQVRAKITLPVENQEILTEQESCSLPTTVSPASRYSRFPVRCARLHGRKKRAELLVNFFPELTESDYCRTCQTAGNLRPYKAPKELLIGLLPEKLIPVLIGKKKTPEEMAGAIKSYRLQITGQTDWKSPGVCGRHHARPAFRFSGISTAPGYFLCGRSPGRRRRLWRLQSPVGLVSGSAAGRAAAGEHA